MNLNDVKNNLQVRTHARLEATTGMIIALQYIQARRANVTGKVLSWVAGHGGDVWWIEHYRVRLSVVQHGPRHRRHTRKLKTVKKWIARYGGSLTRETIPGAVAAYCFDEFEPETA